MRTAALDAIAPADVTELIAAQVAKAKKGNAAAAKFVLGFVQGQVAKASAPAPVPPAPAPIQLEPVEPEPPKPVAIAGPDADQQRLLIGMILLNHQPMTVAGLGKLARIEGEPLDALLNHEWFDRQNGSVRLTPIGRNYVG